jgi:nucleotide-binding universal stress UspA family protein
MDEEDTVNQQPLCPVSTPEKLLLATDSSEFSEGAIREAINFAKRCSSKLYAISVLETHPEYETIGSKFYEKEKEEVLKHLELIKARAAGAGVNCDTIFHSGGETYKHIVDEAVAKNIDMIVIGRRGRKGLAKLLMGSVAAKIIGYAPCKVMVVPRAAKIGYQKILVATDGSNHSIAAVAETISIAKRCGSSVIALSAGTTDDELKVAKLNTDNVLEMAGKEGIHAEAVTPRGRSYETIVETAAGRGVDLIVMGAYGKTGLKKILMGSSTERVIGLAGCAVMVVTA